MFDYPIERNTILRPQRLICGLAVVAPSFLRPRARQLRAQLQQLLQLLALRVAWREVGVLVKFMQRLLFRRFPSVPAHCRVRIMRHGVQLYVVFLG